MVTRWGSKGLAGWVLGVVALGGGCGASRRSVDDEAGSAGEGGVAAGVGGGNGGGKAGRSATGTTGGASANSGTSTSGGTTQEGGTNASGGMRSEETGGTVGALGGRSGRGGTGTGGGSEAGAGGSVGGEGASGGALGGGDGGTTGVQCEWVDVTAHPPTVVLLVDTLTSMWEVMPPAWNLVHDGLMHPDQNLGVVAALTNHVRFGFASYKGHLAASEDDPACATMATVAPEFYNFPAIDAAFGAIGYSETERWETPTNYAINHTAAALLLDTEAPGKKYIFLFTDGNPNTCKTIDPQCGQDLSVRAAQDAFANGIGLLVVGLGDIVGSPPTGCSPSARCGEDHLQNLANAGVGAPVMPPPNCDDPTSDSCTFRFEACVEDSVLKASYTPGAADVGSPGVLTSTSLDTREIFFELVTGMLKGLIPCAFELSEPLDPAIAAVNIGGVNLTRGDADGFELDGTELTLSGAACASYRNGYDPAVHGTCSDSN